ncbi:N-6 DNA methylase [Streptomyces sp. HK10]|uniref:N-6 DNA methylase n=1 Tax=Streptomyces sp. HK10 TaxID=3373255 RepID=UPI00374A5927
MDAAPLLRAVERLASDDALLPRGSVPLPDRAEMLLALICLCGFRPQVWSSLRKLADRTARGPETADLRQVIAGGLPTGLSPSTVQSRQGREQALADAVRLIDAHALGEMLSRSVRHLPDHEVAAVAREHHAWRDARATGTAYRGRAEFSRSASIGEIRGNGYALAPSLYVSPAPVEGSAPDHRARIGGLRDELARLHEEAARIDAAVESILRRHNA